MNDDAARALTGHDTNQVWNPEATVGDQQRWLLNLLDETRTELVRERNRRENVEADLQKERESRARELRETKFRIEVGTPDGLVALLNDMVAILPDECSTYADPTPALSHVQRAVLAARLRAWADRMDYPRFVIPEDAEESE